MVLSIQTEIKLQMLQQQNLMDECSDQTSAFSGPVLNKIEHQSHRFRNLVSQLRINKKRSSGESAVTPFHIQNQCQISNIEPVSQKLDKNSFEFDLPTDLPMRKIACTMVPLNVKNKMSDRQIGDRGLKYRPRGAINGRDDIRVRNLSQIHKKIIGSVEKSRVDINNRQHDGLQSALRKLQQIDNNPEQQLSQSKFRITSPNKKLAHPSPSSTQNNKTQRPSHNSSDHQQSIKKSSSKHEKMIIQGKQLQQYLHQISEQKYPTPDSSPSRIYQFFIKISTHFGIEHQFHQPLIKRYRNCIYFGHKVPQYGAYMGFVYYYRKALYYGEFQRGRKCGYGLEIDMEDQNNQCIWRGSFLNGKKTGYFQLISPKIQYNGSLVNSYFDGEGMLKTIGYSVYKGTFQAGMKHGFGVQTFENKKSLTYKGEYFENKFEGKGQLEGPNYFYKGYFRNSKPHGEGFERNNQFEYEGQFKNGKKSGMGVLKLKTGQQFKGLFENGQIVKQSPIQISRGNYKNNESPTNQYIKNIKIQSSKKYEQQSSFTSSPILAQQLKIKPPTNGRQQCLKSNIQHRKQLKHEHLSRTVQVGQKNIDISNYESRIVPLDRHLSKRLSSLYEQNENEEGTIDHTKYHANAEVQNRGKNVGLFKMHQVPTAYNFNGNLHDRSGDNRKQYDRIQGMASPDDQDDEEEPLGIKVAPRQ